MSKLSTEEVNQAVGLRLAAVRTHAGLSQNAFAESIGVSARAYQNYERGEREIPAAILGALFAAFQIDPLWILSGPGDEPIRAGARPVPALLEDVVLVVEQWLQRRRKALAPPKKARLIRLLYEHFLARGEVDKEHVDAMLMLAA